VADGAGVLGLLVKPFRSIQLVIVDMFPLPDL